MKFNKICILFAIFIIAPFSLAAQEDHLEGTWSLYAFQAINTETGKIEWQKEKEYNFIDDFWVRIEKNNEKHEYKCIMKENYLKIGNDEYVIVSRSDKQLKLVGAWDMVGNERINTKGMYKLIKNNTSN